MFSSRTKNNIYAINCNKRNKIMSFESLKNQQGLTVVELLIAALILVIVLTSGYLFFSYGWRAFDTGSERSIVNNNLRMAAEAISNEIRYAGMLEIIDTAEVPGSVTDDKIYIYLNLDGRIEKKDQSGSTIIPHELDANIAFSLVFSANPPNTMIVNITENTSGISLDTEVRLLNVSAGNPIGGLSSGEALEFEMGDFGGSGGNAAIPVEIITLTPTDIALDIGETANVTYLVTPANATNPSVSWSSGNQAVVTVSEQGVVTGTGVGTTIVTVTANDGGGASDTVNVTVNNPVVNVTGVDLTLTTLSMFVGDKVSISAVIEPENATNKDLSWAMDPSGIFSYIVSGDSVEVSAINPGNATIIVTTVSGGFSDSCSIEVKVISIIGPIALDVVRNNDRNITVTFDKDIQSSTVPPNYSYTIINNNSVRYTKSSNFVSNEQVSVSVTGVNGGISLVTIKRTGSSNNWSIIADGS